MVSASLFAIKSGVPAKIDHEPHASDTSYDPDSVSTLQRAHSFGSDSLSGMSRATSLSSDILATDCSMLLDTTDFFAVQEQQQTPNERWRKTAKLVQKGVAFSQTFRALRDLNGADTIDPSRITKIRQVGSGAFATVDVCWLASQDAKAPATQVAVKRLKYEALRHRSDLERFFKEAEILKRLRHRYISGYVGVGNFSEGTIESMPPALSPSDAKAILKSTFIVQEYIDGGTLKDIVVDAMIRKRTYTDQQACEWMRQIGEGLQYLHSSDPKVMHRDLKLENILMRDLPGGQKEACLADFGISVLLPSQPKESERSTSGKLRRRSGSISADFSKSSSSRHSLQRGTQEWQELSQKVEANLDRSDTAMEDDMDAQEAAEVVVLTAKTGSFMYMAPEVFAAQQYNEKADVFSFGCIMQEVFSRIVLSTLIVGPTGNPAAAKIYASKISEGYRRSLPKSMPLELQHLIAECLTHDSAQRPSMDAVLARLETLTETGALSAGAGSEGRTWCACCSIM